MIKTSRRLTAYDKQKLLEEQNKLRKKYGLRPLKTLNLENLIYLQPDKTTNKTREDTSQKHGGMYQ